MRELEATRALRTTAYANLVSNTFDNKHYAAKVLRRASLELGADPGAICPVNVTIEHVLPRGFADGSGWRHHFKTEKFVKNYTHRLGNLTFLTGEQNRLADACDWSEKRKIYAQSSFALTRELAGISDWTPGAIEERTERLSRLLFNVWQIET